MKKERKKVRTTEGIREYTYLGCPLTRNRTPWCFRLCIPDANGRGKCARLAPHGFKSRIQLSIEAHNKKKLLEAHFEKLEHMYLAAPCNEYYEPGVRISEGAAEIVIPIKKKFFHAAGAVHESVLIKAMSDSALLAVNSAIERVFVSTVNFNTYLAYPVATGELIARGRFMSKSGNHYMAEAVLTDSEGNEIGRGSGTFKESRTSLSARIGYE